MELKSGCGEIENQKSRMSAAVGSPGATGTDGTSFVGAGGSGGGSGGPGTRRSGWRRLPELCCSRGLPKEMYFAYVRPGRGYCCNGFCRTSCRVGRRRGNTRAARRELGADLVQDSRKGCARPWKNGDVASWWWWCYAGRCFGYESRTRDLWGLCREQARACCNEAAECAGRGVWPGSALGGARGLSRSSVAVP